MIPLGRALAVILAAVLGCNGEISAPGRLTLPATEHGPGGGLRPWPHREAGEQG